ncbi:unnamed protein product [Adineta steineri]|uniref:U-box domain-containing protein n=1 Tax=Adineta steineri TaxID=433720 RepID=A0A813MKN2_9BILA|nr:unnamed protein product [Adineta steineri]CAF3684647.1 unnamed protein product [Adineta steineri]
MKYELQRSFRRFNKKVHQVGSTVTRLIRRDSSPLVHVRRRIRSTVSSPPLSDSDDDTFSATPTESFTDDAESEPPTTLPCEFCSRPQPINNLLNHQNRCRANPDRTPGRHPAVHAGPPARHPRRPRSRHVVSENVLQTASAPPRTRTPSPTENFPVSSGLVCPITKSVFRNPVIGPDGHTYERDAIVPWVEREETSPMTREPLSVSKLIPNRAIKQVADDFRRECQRKSLYKYKLDVDVKKTEQIPFIKTPTKSIYRAEWIGNDTSSNNSNIILVHLIGEHAEKIAKSNCQLKTHENIVPIFGRVEHNDSGILLVQEYPSMQTLSQLIKDDRAKLTIEILDFILYQIASGLQHLSDAKIIHGNITADDVLIYRIDEIPENISVKLNNIDDADKFLTHTPPEVLSQHVLEKSDVFAFGRFAQELYSDELEVDNQNLRKRQILCERCLAGNPHERPTFNELLKSFKETNAL